MKQHRWRDAVVHRRRERPCDCAHFHAAIVANVFADACGDVRAAAARHAARHSGAIARRHRRAVRANQLSRRCCTLSYVRWTCIGALHGGAIRRGVNNDLGFSDADRAENIRRVWEVARFMVDARLIAIVAWSSPFRHDRDLARAKFAPGEFVEVFVDTPLALAEERDVKGLYRRARAGLLPQFTGVDSAYEPPPTRASKRSAVGLIMNGVL